MLRSMSRKRKHTGVTYRQVKGTYVIEDRSHSNIVIISRVWKIVVARAEKILNVVLPKGPPSGGGMCA